MAKKEQPPVVTIEGVEPSESVRAKLAAEGKPVLLSFSRGKDSIAAWLALREAGVEVIPFTFIRVPGVKFVEESLEYFEDFFGQHINRVTHPATLRQLRTHMFMDPASCSVIDACDSMGYTALLNPPIKYEEMDRVLRAEFTPDDPKTWVADGVRAADSIRRRMSMTKTGPMYEKTRKVHPVWDWRISTIREAVDRNGIKLPVDYDWFGRSWDGLQYEFMEPLARNRPEDFEVVKSWFPQVEVVFVRRELELKYGW